MRRISTLLGAGTLAALAAAPGPAFAAASPPSLTSAFTPAAITVGGTTALSFTITNPNSSGSLSGIGFTDTLPAGVVVDNPNGLNGTCGSTSTLTANPGSNTITLAAGKLAAGANCTVSAAVTSNTPGSVQNSTGPVSSTEGGAGSGDTQTLAVIALPTVSVRSPTEGSTFNFGQRVIARYSCKEATGGPGLSDCSGDAPSGSPIDTTAVGAQTFSVSAISADGGVTTQTIDYTVRPDNRFKLTKLKAQKGGSVSFAITLPGPGKLSVIERTGSKRLNATKLTLKRARTVRLTLGPGASGARLLKQNTKVSVRLKVQFTPTGGLPRTITTGAVRIKP